MQKKYIKQNQSLLLRNSDFLYLHIIKKILHIVQLAASTNIFVFIYLTNVEASGRQPKQILCYSFSLIMVIYLCMTQMTTYLICCTVQIQQPCYCITPMHLPQCVPLKIHTPIFNNNNKWKVYMIQKHLPIKYAARIDTYSTYT